MTPARTQKAPLVMKNSKSAKSAKSTTATAPVQAPAPVASAPAVTPTPERPPLPVLDFEKRREYRQLPTESVLELLRTEAPKFFSLAEVVGKWVWVQFADKQPREVTGALSQLGFHWNNKRQAWQHPCGMPLARGSGRGWQSRV